MWLWYISALHAQEVKRTFAFNGLIKTTDGTPVADASVHLHETRQTQLSNAQGRFVFTTIRAGHYHLHITHINFIGRAIELDIYSDTSFTIVLEPSQHKLDEVTVESDPLKLDNQENSLYITRVTEQDVVRHATGNLSQTLERLPGISSINVGVSVAKPVIRGLSFNRIMVLDNGIKQEGQQWGSDHGLEIDQYAVEELEILKGPAALLYGSDAMAGVISISKPLYMPEGTFQANVQPLYRSVNHTIGASAMVRGNSKGFIYKVRITGMQYGDYQVPANEFTYTSYKLTLPERRLKNTAGNEEHAQLVLGMNKNWGYTHLTFSTFNQKQGMFAGAVGIPRNYTLASDGNTRNISLPYQRISHHKLISNSNVKLGSGWIETDLGFQWNDRNEYSRPDAHGQAPVTASTLALGLDLITLSALTRYHRSLAANWDGIFGMQWQHQINHKTGFEHLIPPFKQMQTGFFGIQKFRYSERLVLNGGARIDLAHIQAQPSYVPVYNLSTGDFLGMNQRNDFIKRSMHQVSIAVGCAYHISNQAQIKLNLSRNFRFPTVQELTMNGMHHGTFRHEQGDATLRNEIGYQTDLGFFWELGRIHLSFTPFYNYFENYIYLSPTARFSTLPEGGQLYRFTQAPALHYGGETQLEIDITNQISLHTYLAYVHATNLQTMLPLPLTPPLNHLAELEYHVKVKGNIRMLSLKWAQHTYAAQNRVDRNEKSTPAYTLSNIYATVSFGRKKEKQQLVWQVNNVFNTVYMNHLSRWRYLNLPEAGRNISILFRMLI